MKYTVQFYHNSVCTRQNNIVSHFMSPVCVKAYREMRTPENGIKIYKDSGELVREIDRYGNFYNAMGDDLGNIDEIAFDPEKGLRQQENIAAYLCANGNLDSYIEDVAAGYCA